MAKKRNIIPYMDAPDWVWIPEGEEYWKRSDGSLSDQKHAYNIVSGQSVSVRQAQNEQRRNKAALGIPKSPTIHRKGVVRRQPGKFSAIHGNSTSFYSRDLDSLQEKIQATVPRLTNGFGRGIIILHFTEVVGNYPVEKLHGSKKHPKLDYAALNSQWYFVDNIVEDDTMWNEARAHMINFNWDENSSPAPFQLFLVEK